MRLSPWKWNTNDELAILFQHEFVNNNKSLGYSSRMDVGDCFDYPDGIFVTSSKITSLE